MVTIPSTYPSQLEVQHDEKVAAMSQQGAMAGSSTRVGDGSWQSHHGSGSGRRGAPASAVPETSSSLPRHHAGGHGSVVLRVKRKRGTDPITALRIEALISEGLDVQQAERAARQELSPSSPPVDHLLGTSPDERALRTKRQMTASQGFFQLAETVSMDSFDSEEKTKRLQERIRRRIRDKPSRFAKSSGSRPSTPTSVRGKDAARAATTHQAEHSSASQKIHRSEQEVPVQGSTANPRRRLRVIDAIINAEERKDDDSSKRNKSAAGGAEFASRDVEMDSLDRRFADLLGDFLRDQNLEPPSDLHLQHSKAAPESDLAAGHESDDSEADYVYDIYYRVKDSLWTSGSSGAADVGLRPATVAGRDRRIASGISTPQHQHSGPPISALALPTATLVDPAEQSFFMDDSEEMQAEIEQGSKLVADERYDSDHPFDDGEDEDSNDEDFYKNEYPEDDAGNDDEDELGDFDDETGSPVRSSAVYGWSGPRRTIQTSGLYDSDGSGRDSEEDEDY